MDVIELSGSVERITFYNDKTGYSVVRVSPDSGQKLPSFASSDDELATVVGVLPGLLPGEWIKLTGKWNRHPKHGWQFSAEKCNQRRPATLSGVRRYLGSGLLPGVGPAMAERIVAHFGENTLDVIEHSPERLREVLGIGSKRVETIGKAWQEQKEIQQVMIFLQSYDLSTSLAVKIYKRYGNNAIQIVSESPYRLVQDISGIGFKTADKIAQSMGLASDSPARIEAGVAYTLNKMAESGHVYVPQEELEPLSAEILTLPIPSIRQVIDQLEQSALLKRETIRYELPEIDPATASFAIKEERAVYLSPFYYCEVGLTKRVQDLVEHPTSRLAAINLARWQHLFQLIESRSGLKLEKQQRVAIFTALQHKVTILTGGPGTGKTTTLRTLLNVLDEAKKSYILASPTGRAAKRLMETTGREAKTLHRLLEFHSGGFLKNERNPIRADFIVIDEASMLDMVLANHLLKAITPDTHLLLVGDVDQLPSVGAGDVLRDLIDSKIAQVVRLEVIFRQSAESLIITNSHRINRGEMPITPSGANDFFIFIKNEPEEQAELIVDIVKNRLPSKFGFAPLDDIQLLCPMYNSRVGVHHLNQQLQLHLNPASPDKTEWSVGGTIFRVGDKVMQVVNNYDKGVFNGDIGRITMINHDQQKAYLLFDDEHVLYQFDELEQLVLAYAITVHKSQGSEYPCVVIPVTTQHYLMLQRNLLYTAVTRAKQVVVLVGTRRAIQIAINNNRVNERHTALKWRLSH